MREIRFLKVVPPKGLPHLVFLSHKARIGSVSVLCTNPIKILSREGKDGGVFGVVTPNPVIPSKIILDFSNLTLNGPKW